MVGTEAPFLGREPELAGASAALAEAVAGHAAVVLVAGEGGIGKSRLCLELTRQAEEQGVTVAWGRAWEAGGAPPYWPWIQSLRAAIHQSGHDVGALRERISSLLDPLPAHSSRGTRGSRGESRDAETTRFELFQGIADLIRQLARERPVAFVLDDVHLADDPSLLLLRFVVRELRNDRILVAAAYRPNEVRRRASAESVLNDLQRLPSTRYVEPAGVSADAVEVWARRALGDEGAAIAQAVHSRTDGNPLFSQELIRLLAAGHRPQARGLIEETFPLSDVGRTILVERLKALEAEERNLLRLASVIGREFDIDAPARSDRMGSATSRSTPLRPMSPPCWPR